ncbi:PAS domain S-box protein [Flavobacterium antarcticum]|uniref:PAS domain S-box protein n=1 Tax=Flavobacterium antarcticum TaxID=271155 RepID=UPI0003B2E9DE|nr:PAS domain S-box protein [Flavobacterium antarcticum]
MKNRENNRLLEVKKYLQLDFNASDDFKNIVELAAKLCDKPVALITLLDDKYNWLKVKYGTDIEAMPRETSFCQFGIQQDEIMIVEDATKDIRFDQNELVHSNPNLRFYAGVPLTLKNGEKLGTLCLFDQNPNSLTEIQKKTLTLFAKQATVLMELAMSQIQLQRQVEETEAKNVSLIKIAQLQSHQIRQPLTTLMGLINSIKEGYQKVDAEWLTMFETATGNFDNTIRNIVAESTTNIDLRSLRFNKIVEEIDDYAVLILDEKGTIENWNKGAENIKGYTAEEIIGKNFSVFYTEEDILNSLPQRLLSRAEIEGVAKEEGWRLRKDGSTFWGSISITAIHDENRKVIGFTKVTKDLTSLKKAENEKLLSTDMYNLMAEYTSRAIRIGGWEFDLLKNEVVWTAMTKEIHGVPIDYVPHLKTALNFYKKGESRIKITNAVKHAIHAGTPWDLELQISTKHGEDIWVRTTGKSDFKAGLCTKVYGTFHDISASK